MANIFTKFRDNLAAKALTSMVYGRGGPRGWLSLLPRTKVNYAGEIGDGTNSDIVMSNVFWLMNNIQEPPMAMSRRAVDGDDQPLDGHPLLDLLESPNPAYDGGLLWAATELSYVVDGNGYWILIRSGAGRVVEIWWTPHWMIEPMRPRDGSQFVSHYRYSPGNGRPIDLDPEDVVHFRFGLDPDGSPKGISRLKAVMRELFTDAEAANWTAALLRNSGVPSVLITPHPNAEIRTNPDDLDATNAYVSDKFTGDNRGGPMAIGAPVEVHPFGFNPQQMDLKSIRRVPEERGCAAIGVPPIVAGFGAGLEHATYSNYQIAERVVYRNNLVPTWRAFGRTIRRQLLNHIEPDIGPFNVYFDTSDIEALQEDRNTRAERIRADVAAGIATLAEGREERGYPVQDNQRVFLRPVNIVEVPEDQVGQPPEPALPPGPPEEPDEPDPTEEPEE